MNSSIFSDYGLHGNSTHCRGLPYNQIFEHFPRLECLYSDFEKGYDANPVLKTLQSMNIYGAVRTVPHLLYRIVTVAYEDTICEDPCTAFGSGAAGLATQLFILSKVPELLDTAFLILKKKPITFLHWYHHITVLLYCWNSYLTESSTGLYFVAMNYTVHSIMYSYYCLQTLRMLPRWFPAYLITILQIAQMFVGALVVLSSAYYYVFGGSKYAPGECNDHPSNIVSGGVMYASYLYLFVQFAIKRFVRRAGPERAEKKAL
eukprot:gene13180-15191_t